MEKNCFEKATRKVIFEKQNEKKNLFKQICHILRTDWNLELELNPSKYAILLE